MNIFLSKLAAGIVTIALSISSFISPAPKAPMLGAAPQFTAAKPSTLYGSGISSSDTSIKLTSLVTPSGAPITTAQLIGGTGNLFYGTIEPTTSKKETVGCTGVTQNADNTALLTGCSRGLQFTYPYTASTSLAKTHSGGATFVLSNSPQLYQDIINYVASSSYAGSVDASLTVKGIVEIASGQEAASTTAVGGGNTSAPLALSTAISTSTKPTSGNYVVVTKIDGKIDSNFLSFISTSTATTQTISGTTTLATSTNIGSTPAFQIGKNLTVFTSNGLFTVPNGVTKVLVELVGAGGNGGAGDGSSHSGNGGGGGGYCRKIVDVTSTSTITVTVGSSNTFFSSFASSTAGTTGDSYPGNGGDGGIGKNCDLNIQGQGGGSTGSQTTGLSGMGGSSVLGGGGAGVSSGNGKNGGNYGGGGSGGSGLGSVGTGAPGVAIITY